MKFSMCEINKKLLRIKAHYFLNVAAFAPISPFIPTIANDLGFTPVSLGWIYTITPILSFFIKPLVGGIADKFKVEKSIFIFLIILSAVAFHSIQWVPPLVNDSQVNMNCNNLSVEVCSDKLNDVTFRDHTLGSTTRCKFSEKDTLVEAKGNSSGYMIDDTSPGDGIYHTADFNITHSQGRCINLMPVAEEELFMLCNNVHRNSSIFPIEIKCGNGIPLDEKISENEMLFKYQFWLLLVLVVTARVSMGICSSLADTICFHLLGDKPENFGMQKAWAAMGWGFSSFISSLFVDAISQGKERKDYSISFYILAGLYVLDLIVVIPLKIAPRPTSKNIVGDITYVLKDTKICLFLVWVFLNGCFFSTITSFLFLSVQALVAFSSVNSPHYGLFKSRFVQDLDMSQGSGQRDYINTLEGLMLMVQTNGSEVPIFFFSGWILKKVGHPNAMTICLFAYALRFFLYTQLVNPWFILPIEVLHGINYGLFFATMATYAKIISPPGTECTVQSLVSVMFEGAGLSVGSLLTGYLVQAMGYAGTFSLLATFAFIFGLIHFTIINFYRLLGKINSKKFVIDGGK